jgi:hypothetical protein
MPALPEISPSTMYLVLNLGILPFWALLIVLPRARITDTLVHSVMMPLAVRCGSVIGTRTARTLKD